MRHKEYEYSRKIKFYFCKRVLLPYQEARLAPRKVGYANTIARTTSVAAAAQDWELDPVSLFARNPLTL